MDALRRARMDLESLGSVGTQHVRSQHDVDDDVTTLGNVVGVLLEEIAELKSRPDDFNAAVLRLVNYNWADERRDWEEQGRPAHGHIFNDLAYLRSNINGGTDDNGGS